MPWVTCLACGTTFWKKESHFRKSPNHFCSRPCHHIWLRQWIEVTCENCGIKIKKPPYRVHQSQHHFCSETCAKEYMKGDRAGNWQGAMTYYGATWRNIREQILERDGYQCVKCGRGDGKLNVHHLIPYLQFPGEPVLFNNLCTLCAKCHLWLHRWGCNTSRLKNKGG